MFGYSVSAAAAAAVVSVVLCVSLSCAQADGVRAPAFLLFAGTDLWRYGAFLYGGAVWSPAGVDTGGFALKLLFNGGGYTYTSGAQHTDIDGAMLSAAAMPGWRFTRDSFTVSLFAGPVVQDYRLTPYDPSGRLHRLYVGGQFATEVWYQPTRNTMAAVNGSIASVGPNGSVRVAFGVRAFDAMFVGPETAALWCGNFQQMEFGAHVTGFHFNAMEWSAGGGWAIDTDKRAGPYMRLGISAKY